VCAVVAKNDDGNMQKGVLMFVYGSNALTSGMDLAVVVFSLNPLKIALPQLRGGCSTVLPLEAIGSDFYAQVVRDHKLAIQEAIRDKHAYKTFVQSPSEGKRLHKPINNSNNATSSQKPYKNHKNPKNSNNGDTGREDNKEKVAGRKRKVDADDSAIETDTDQDSGRSPGCCPKGHRLEAHTTTNASFACDMCSRRQKKGSEMLGCHR